MKPATLVEGTPAGAGTEPILRVRGLERVYGDERKADAEDAVRAVDGVTFDVARGQTFGIVGESGSGKSTIARLLVGLDVPSAGSVVFDGIDVHATRGAKSRELRRRQQLVFQDPMSSLNRRKTVRQALSSPLEVHGWSRKRRVERVDELIDLVGLNSAHAEAYPSELSGGQAQRVAIARALALEPELVVLDEAVSSLDVSVQAQVLNLLRDLQRRLGLTYVFIAHDLAIVRYMAATIAVMYAGRIVELASRSTLFSAPAHPYTRALLAAIPAPDPRQARQLGGADVQPTREVPTTSGCRYRPRCPVGLTSERCVAVEPTLDKTGPGHSAACHFPGRTDARAPGGT